jgi:hypothetical protein
MLQKETTMNQFFEQWNELISTMLEPFQTMDPVINDILKDFTFMRPGFFVNFTSMDELPPIAHKIVEINTKIFENFIDFYSKPYLFNSSDEQLYNPFISWLEFSRNTFKYLQKTFQIMGGESMTLMDAYAHNTKSIH